MVHIKFGSRFAYLNNKYIRIFVNLMQLVVHRHGTTV